MSAFKGFTQAVKEMVSTPLTASSQKASWDKRKIGILIISFFSLLVLGAFAGWLIVNSGDDKNNESSQGVFAAKTFEGSEDGALVIHFNEKANAGVSGSSRSGTQVRASTGTLVRVKLLNSLETYDNVPVFAQIVDHSLGSSFYGWTLIGDASSDSNVDRIKMTFALARSPQGNRSLDLRGQALSLDGTLGVRASKVEGVANRALIGGAASGISGSIKGSSQDLSSLVLRALLSGLQKEISSDLGAAYTRGAVLSLKQGQEFFVQLTENF